jgi:hypothetical protein
MPPVNSQQEPVVGTQLPKFLLDGGRQLKADAVLLNQGTNPRGGQASLEQFFDFRQVKGFVSGRVFRRDLIVDWLRLSREASA